MTYTIPDVVDSLQQRQAFGVDKLGLSTSNDRTFVRSLIELVLASHFRRRRRQVGYLFIEQHFELLYLENIYEDRGVAYC